MAKFGSQPEKFLTKKSLGQHFLASDIVPNWMCDAANLVESDTVLEIGPGTGALTKVLLERQVKVVALETDERAIVVLKETFTDEIKSGQLVIYHHDVREISLSNIPEISNGKYVVVANIPYYLSGFLFRTFLETTTQPKTLVFLVQKEVARRACSTKEKGDKESLLSLSVQAYGQARYIKSVSRGHFTPPPKVDSGIIAIYEINRDVFKKLNERHFFALLHLGFGKKRKQLLGNLAEKHNRAELINIFSTLSIPTNIRAEDLPLNTWLKLADLLQRK